MTYSSADRGVEVGRFDYTGTCQGCHDTLNSFSHTHTQAAGCLSSEEADIITERENSDQNSKTESRFVSKSEWERDCGKERKWVYHYPPFLFSFLSL